MINPQMQQQLVMQKLTVGDPAIGFVNTADYTIEYYGFITLGNTNDTIVTTINGVSDITFSMMGMLEIPLQSIEVTAVNPSQNETTIVYRGLLVFGIKKFKSIF
jgi:hypothetical protein